MDIRQLVFGQIGIARYRRRRGRLLRLETRLAWPIETVFAILPESALALRLALLRPPLRSALLRSTLRNALLRTTLRNALLRTTLRLALLRTTLLLLLLLLTALLLSALLLIWGA